VDFSKMEDKDIYAIFSNLVDEADQDNESLKSVFKTLIKSTLAYRDNVLNATGVVVTVEDVRAVLEWLEPAIKTGRLPKSDNKIRLDLLKLWLDELKLLTSSRH
jgi:hypothetical protein